MEESRQLLEACVNEFFNPGTTNDRKRQIELMLDSFSKQPGSWKQALHCLSHSRHNHYMLMYCLSVIESAIKCQWLLMNESEHTELKSTLYVFLMQHATSSSLNKCPTFIRNKIVKVLTDVGKFSWPQSYPEFFSNVLQISQSDDTVILGVLFLKTISEEWSNVKDEISTFRKIELKVRLVQEMQRIFELLNRILEAGLNERRTNPTVCPSPQSPTNPTSQSTAIPDPSSVHSDLMEIVSLALETTGHYSSWIPLDGVFTSTSSNSNNSPKCPPFPVSFVKLLSQFALFDTGPSSVATTAHSVLALGVLNEILYRKFIPKEFDEQLTFVVHFGVELLNKILNQTSFSNLQDQYLEKVIEFLCLVVSSHFHRYDEHTAKAFMSLLLPFTFKQEECGFYYECLEVWSRLLDHLNAQITVVSMTSGSRDEYLLHYKQPILALANGIVHSTAKFQINRGDEAIDTEDDEDSDTPGLVRNIDILVKIGELLPAESLESLTSTWSESCRFYVSLQSLMDPTMVSLNLSNPIEIEHFNFIVQMIGRMANIFYGDVFKQELLLGRTLYQQLVNVFCFSKHFYLVKNPDLVVKSNCEISCCVRTWTFWLSRFHSEIVLSESTLADQQFFFEILSTLMDIVAFTLDNRTKKDLSIVSSNANLLATLVNAIRTQYIFQSPCVQTLIQQIHNMKASLDSEVYRVLSKVVATVLLLPWQGVSQQEWEMRTQLYTTYMKLLLEEICQPVVNPTGLVASLVILNDQLDLLMTECSNSKNICWNVIKQVVPYLQKLSSTKLYIYKPDVSEQILNFFLKIMEVLKQQTGAQFFEETIRGFLSLFSSENLITDLLRETESSSIVVEKFLQMLKFMVKDPSPSFRKFLPEALSICYDHVYPVLAQRSTPDLKISFFHLIRDTLNYRWNYFFPTIVLLQQNASPNSQNPRPQQDICTGKRLDEILQSIGHSFLQSDLEVFKFNLASLTSWNEKHNLYQKLSSHGQIIEQFITVLLQVLIQKSHDLLRDELSRVLHEMASIDFLRYRSDFLPKFLEINLPSIPEEQRLSLSQKFGPPNTGSSGSNNNENVYHMDLPSFTLLLNQFLEDIRYFYFLVECQRLNPSDTSRTDGSADNQIKPP